MSLCQRRTEEDSPLLDNLWEQELVDADEEIVFDNAQDTPPKVQVVKKKKKTRFANNVDTPIHMDESPWRQILILLLAPRAKKFEFVHLEYFYHFNCNQQIEQPTVADLLEQLPRFALDQDMRQQTYKQLIVVQKNSHHRDDHHDDKQAQQKPSPLKSLDPSQTLVSQYLPHKQILVAVQQDYTGQELVKLATPLLQNRQITRAVTMKKHTHWHRIIIMGQEKQQQQQQQSARDEKENIQKSDKQTSAARSGLERPTPQMNQPTTRATATAIDSLVPSAPPIIEEKCRTTMPTTMSAIGEVDDDDDNDDSNTINHDQDEQKQQGMDTETQGETMNAILRKNSQCLSSCASSSTFRTANHCLAGFSTATATTTTTTNRYNVGWWNNRLLLGRKGIFERPLRQRRIAHNNNQNNHSNNDKENDENAITSAVLHNATKPNLSQRDTLPLSPTTVRNNLANGADIHDPSRLVAPCRWTTRTNPSHHGRPTANDPKDDRHLLNKEEEEEEEENNSYKYNDDTTSTKTRRNHRHHYRSAILARLGKMKNARLFSRQQKNASSRWNGPSLPALHSIINKQNRRSTCAQSPNPSSTTVASCAGAASSPSTSQDDSLCRNAANPPSLRTRKDALFTTAIQLQIS